MGDIKKNIDDIIRKMGSEQLYHYTSLSALIGILENREVWFGNTANMNDKEEVVNFVNNLERALLEVLSPAGKDRCKTFFIKLYERIKKEYPYAMCFSTLRDNAAQWDRYANSAKGVCIVFNANVLLDVIYRQWWRTVVFNKVTYGYDTRNHELYKSLCEYFDTGKLVGYINDEAIEDSIILCSYFFKHNSFCTESEIRATTLWSKIPKCSTVNYILSGDVVRKILKLNLGELCEIANIDFEDLFEEIIIGPRSLQSEYELKEYVKSLGCDKIAERITISKCPLR